MTITLQLNTLREIDKAALWQGAQAILFAG